ncbi:hypothetical protein ACUH95_06215, partial [Dermabacteraceae bacterium P13101]
EDRDNFRPRRDDDRPRRFNKDRDDSPRRFNDRNDDRGRRFSNDRGESPRRRDDDRGRYQGERRDDRPRRFANERGDRPRRYEDRDNFRSRRGDDRPRRFNKDRDDRPRRFNDRDDRPRRFNDRNEDRPRRFNSDRDERSRRFDNRDERPRKDNRSGEDRRSGGTDRPQRSFDERRDNGPRRDAPRNEYRRVRDDTRDSRPGQDRREKRAGDPEVPEFITGRELDDTVLSELRTLSRESAEKVGGHIVAAGYFLADDPERALAHARAAVRRGGRVAAAREICGILLYQSGEYGEALKELRTAMRLSADPSLLPMIADCERGLGRPEKALDVSSSAEAEKLSASMAIELLIVVAGAYSDMGDTQTALKTLDIPALRHKVDGKWQVRLWVAYADVLAMLGRNDESQKWLRLAADADTERVSDARDRLGYPPEPVADDPFEDNERVTLLDVYEMFPEEEAEQELEQESEETPEEEGAEAAETAETVAAQEKAPEEETVTDADSEPETPAVETEKKED